MEVACLTRHKLIGVYQQSKIGVVHIKIHESKLILARLDGSIDFVNLSLSEEKVGLFRRWNILVLACEGVFYFAHQIH